MQYTILLFSYHRKQFSFYRWIYLILQLKVQFGYEISQHTSEILRHVEMQRHIGCKSLS
jgi:hypothetical protein